MAIIRMGRWKIGEDQPPFIVAEMSGNHQNSLEKAFRIVDEAAKAGASAVKLQTYTADTMTLDLCLNEFFISDRKSLWKGKSLYELYKIANTPWAWHKPIFDYCKKRGVLAFSTPFDASAVDFLEAMQVPMYKIASFENTDIPLIRKVAKTKKPVIISTGMATQNELEEAVETARTAGCKDLILLKCTSAYPADSCDANLRTIPAMAKKFQCLAGLSDHTRGIGVSVAAVACGAVMIERHLTVDRNEGGVDSVFSLEPYELKQLVVSCREAREALGNVTYGPGENEKKSMHFRRSLYVVEDVLKGDKFTARNIRNIRPGYGLPPKYYDVILGRTAKKNLKKGAAFRWEFVR